MSLRTFLLRAYDNLRDIEPKAGFAHVRAGRSARVRPGTIVSVILAGFTLVYLGGCEIRPLDPDTGRAVVVEEEEKFDAASFVEENWSARILPAIRSDAVDIDTVLASLKTMEAVRLAALQSETRMVQGRGRVTALDDVSRARLLRVDALPYDGKDDYALQIGPVIRGTAIRDAVPFISFDQFVNQLEYASVARSLNDRLVDDVLSDLNPEILVGSEIVFVGVLPLRNPDELMVTPIEIRRTDG